MTDKNFDSSKEVWRDDASCKGQDLSIFFIENEDGSISRKNIKKAKSICLKCLVQVKCLSYALNEDIRYGIWGGITPRERSSLIKSIKNNDVIDIPIKLVDNKFITPTENRRIPWRIKREWKK